MTIEVRRVDEADLARVAALLEQLGYPSDAAALQGRLTSWTTSRERDLFVATCANSVVGLLALTVTPRLDNDTSWAQVVALVIDRDHRRQGIGRALLVHAERHAHEHGCDTVIINSARARPEAHDFYRGLGYRDRCDDHAQYVRSTDRPRD